MRHYSTGLGTSPVIETFENICGSQVCVVLPLNVCQDDFGGIVPTVEVLGSFQNCLYDGYFFDFRSSTLISGKTTRQRPTARRAVLVVIHLSRRIHRYGIRHLVVRRSLSFDMSSRLGTIDLGHAIRPFAEVDKNLFADVCRQDLQLSLVAKHRAGTFLEPLESLTACSVL